MGFGSTFNSAMGMGGSILGGIGGFFGPNKGVKPTYDDTYKLPGFQSQYDQYGRMSGQYGGRAAPQMGESSFRGDQTALVRMLRSQAQGHGPGQAVVRMQAQQMADRGAKQQLAAAQGGAAGGSAMAARNAAMGTAAMQSQVGGQAAMGGLQAQLGAMGQLGQVAQGARGQDLARASGNAGLELQSRGINDQAQLEALRQRLQASGMQQQGGLAFNNNMAQYNAARMAQPSTGQQLMGAAMGAGQMYLMGGGSFGGLGAGGGASPYGQLPANSFSGGGAYSGAYGYDPRLYGTGTNG